MSERIVVETVGYYSRDRDFNITIGDLPIELNANGIQALYHPAESVLLNTELQIPADFEDQAPENYMQSMLSFIQQQPGVLAPSVEFVSFRKILTKIAASPHLKEEIVLFRWNDINYACWLAEGKMAKPGTREFNKLARGQTFADLLTKEHGSKIYKAVNRVTVTMPDKSKMVLLISAEIDARLPNDDTSSGIEHVEIKSTLKDQPEWLRKNSCDTYWQAVFGNTNRILLGKLKYESVKDGNDSVEKVIIRKISNFTRTSLLNRANEHYTKWSREEGENRITEFLKYQKERLTRNGQAIVMKQEQINDQVEWTAEDVDPESIEFCRWVRNSFI